MHNIGYISLAQDWKHEYFDLFDKTKFAVNQISEHDTEFFSEQQVLLIEVSSLEDLPSICQLLLKVKEYPELLIYIISSLENIDQVTRTVFLQLGANGVKDETMSIEELSLIISNTLTKMYANKSDGIHLVDTELVSEELKFQLNANNLSIVTNQGEISLTKLEYQIMDLLYRNMGRAVTYVDIFENVWKSNNPIDDDEKKSRIANAIFHLRKKMAGDSNCIKTVRSKGYMLSI